MGKLFVVAVKQALEPFRRGATVKNLARGAARVMKAAARAKGR
jgi:hypothetical protein